MSFFGDLRKANVLATPSSWEFLSGTDVSYNSQITISADAGDIAFYPKGGIKHHDHLTDREYAYQLRTETTRTTTIFRGMDCEVHTGASMTAGGIHGLSMAMRVAAAHTVSGTISIAALVGILDVDGTINGASTVCAAGHCKVNDGGTFTAVKHLCSLWLDSAQEGTVTGEHEFIYMTNQGASVMDQVFYIAGNTNKITSLMELFECDSIVGSSNGGGAAVYLDFTIDGVAARITAKYV